MEELTRHQKVAAALLAKDPDHFRKLAKLSNAKPKPRPTSFGNNVELARKAGKASGEARRRAKQLKEESK